MTGQVVTQHGLGIRASVCGSVLAFGTIFLFGVLRGVDEGLYFRVAQEDEALEWATFWAFVFAAGAWGLAAVCQWRRGSGFAWASACLALVCLVVSLEEISWGQRLLGYQPPEYFLASNAQQELNLHNVLGTAVRDIIFVSVVAIYGIALPVLVWRLSTLGRRRWSKFVPPVALTPVFMVTLIFYVRPQWPMMQEIVELTLGLGFLYVAVGVGLSERASDRSPLHRKTSEVTAVLVLTAAVLVAGVACAAMQRSARHADGANRAAARAELDAIRQDFQVLMSAYGHSLPESSGFDQRLYTFVQLNGEASLERGAFAELTVQGMSPTRARYFLDPWNSSYWIRDYYTADRRSRTLSVYSLGPNSRRDSTPEEIRGDDLLIVILSESTPAIHPSR